MKTLTITYQLYVVCSQEIEVPDDYQIPSTSGWEQIQDLREKFPDEEIWDTLPDNDGNGNVDLNDHLDYLIGAGVDIPKDDCQPQFYVNE